MVGSKKDFWQKKGKRCSVGFLGCGNMGKSMLKAMLLTEKTEEPSGGNSENYSGHITVHDPNFDAASFFSEPEMAACKKRVSISQSIINLLFCEVLIVAVKPQMFTKAMQQLLAAAFSALLPAAEVKTCLLVSVMAGIRCEKISEDFLAAMKICIKNIENMGGEKAQLSTADEKAQLSTADLSAKLSCIRCSRIMPNLPLMVGMGAGAYCCNETYVNNQWSSEAASSFLGGITSTMGKFFLVEENLMDVVTAVSGSGPAYFCAFLEQLEMAAVKNGLPANLARELCRQTFFGTAKFLQQTGKDFKSLKREVTSPGGTTAAGLACLETAGFASSVNGCIASAKKRGEELGKT